MVELDYSLALLDARFLKQANNLSDVDNAATARTNLGVAIGSDVQAWDAQLDDIAALAVTDGNFIVGDGTNWVAENGATARTSLGLVAGGAGDIWIEKAGDTGISGNIQFNDSIKLLLGTGSDGEIYSSSDDLYIANVTEDQDIYIQVNDGGVTKEALFIKGSTGDIGIGTASPDYPLHIYRDGVASGLKLESITHGVQLQMRRKTTGNANDLRFFTDGTLDWIFGQRGDLTTDFVIKDQVNDSVRITVETGDADNQLYLKSDGNVGIGVTDPDTKLEIFNAGNQLKLSFDGTDNAIFAVDTDGMLTTTPSGGLFNFAGDVGIGITPTAGFKMGDDKLIAVDVNAGLTASTTQTQGNGALTAQTNEISVVANTNDTVTLPTAVAGLMIEVINNGANHLQIFPASGDDLGVGVNSSRTLEPNERVTFTAYDTTNWARTASTQTLHAEMHDQDNTDAFVINDAGGDFHSYHTNGLAAGDLEDWTFDAGGAGTSFPIASIADGAASGVDIAVTTTGTHGLEVGDIISQTNLADVAYVGIFKVKAIISTTIYEVAAVYTATGTGTMDQAAVLIADAVAAGVYSFAWYVSATSATNNETVDFQLYQDATIITGSKTRRKFGTAADFGSMSGGGVVTVVDGDKISFALSNEDSAGNITIRNLTVVLVRL